MPVKGSQSKYEPVIDDNVAQAKKKLFAPDCDKGLNLTGNDRKDVDGQLPAYQRREKELMASLFN